MKQYNNYADLITFTRASSGTALRPISYGDELVVNGDFSYDGDWTKGDGWSISGGVASVDGTQSGSSNFFQSVSFSTGIYLVSYTATALSGGPLYLYIGGVSQGFVLSAGTHQYIYVSTSTASRDVNIQARVGATATIDNVSVKEVLFDQPDGTLTLFNHPTNVPRIEYDADGNRLGLLVEESRTNLITYSEDYDPWADYAYGGASLSIDYGYASPDGSNSASKLIYTEGSGSNGYLLTNNVTATASVDHSLSIWMKGEVGGEKVRVDFKNSSSSGIAGDIFTLTTEWVKYTVTVLNDTGTSRGFQIRLTSADFVSSQVFYIYGAQLEAGSFPTSYIPTSGSTATRSADVASIDVTDFGYNQSEGTVFVEVDTKSLATDYPRLAFSLGDGTSSNRLMLYKFSDTLAAFDGRVDGAQVAFLTSSIKNSGFNKVAVSFSNNVFNICTNGGIVSSDNSVSMPVGLTVGVIGASELLNGSNNTNGHIKSIKYYPRALTATQIQELTS